MPSGGQLKYCVRPYPDPLAASRGHVIVRVAPGGERYEIFVTEKSSSPKTSTSLTGFSPACCG
jgi:hypothetical protein